MNGNKVSKRGTSDKDAFTTHQHGLEPPQAYLTQQSLVPVFAGKIEQLR